jgi:hypothetical protein
MRRILLLTLALVAASCARQGPDEQFEALALGAGYAQFPRSAVDVVISHTSGRAVACGYARRLDVQPIPRPGEPFIWADGQMYAGARLYGLREGEMIRLCGPNWAAPRPVQPIPPVTAAPAAGTRAAPDRNPAA